MSEKINKNRRSKLSKTPKNVENDIEFAELQPNKFYQNRKRLVPFRRQIIQFMQLRLARLL